MKLPALLASDLHLTSNPADEYRWELFPWLTEQIRRAGAKTLVLCGDLTDAKDYHPSELVNRTVKVIDQMSALCDVMIIRGNHDYLRDGHMFFEFLNALPHVNVITKPCDDGVTDPDGALTLYLPHTKTPMKDWSGFDFSNFAYVFMHQTAPGSLAGNGQAMGGEEMPLLNAAGKVFSGDIHVPQKVGPIEYIGSPYHVHFGDNFQTRVIEIDRSGKQFDLHFPSIRKVMLDVTSLDDFVEASRGLGAKDQVKVRVSLPESEKHYWRAVKATIEHAGADFDLRSVELRVQKSDQRAQAGDRPVALFDPIECVYSYVDGQGLGHELLEAALECMEEK